MKSIPQPSEEKQKACVARARKSVQRARAQQSAVPADLARVVSLWPAWARSATGPPAENKAEVVAAPPAPRLALPAGALGMVRREDLFGPEPEPELEEQTDDEDLFDVDADTMAAAIAAEEAMFEAITEEQAALPVKAPKPASRSPISNTEVAIAPQPRPTAHPPHLTVVQPGTQASSKPVIYVGGHLDVMIDKALDALVQYKKIFQTHRQLSRILPPEFPHPGRALEIHQLHVDATAEVLARAAEWVAITKEGTKPALPPKAVVRAIHFRAFWHGIRPLIGIARAPIFHEDGSIRVEPGYDAETCLYLPKNPLWAKISVPEAPTADDARQAWELWDQEVWVDFPWVSAGDKLAAMGLALSLVLRTTMQDLFPMFLVLAPDRGSGKGLIVETVGTVTTGAPPPTQSAPKSNTDEEWRKQITSILMDPPPLVHIDNVDGTLGNDALSSLLTSRLRADRLLGTNTMVRQATDATVWCASGNNTEVTADTLRRLIPIRLDSGTERPWTRPLQGFRHPHLVKWVREQRAELLSALYTIARAWVVAGKPVPSGTPQLGSFQDWADTITGMLQVAGCQGFLSHLDDALDQLSPEAQAWEAFLARWAQLKLGPLTTPELIARLDDWQLAAYAPESLLTALKRGAVSVGRHLHNRVNRRFGRYHITSTRDSSNRSCWAVCVDDQPQLEPPPPIDF